MLKTPNQTTGSMPHSSGSPTSSMQVRLPQSVEALGGGAGEERDADDEQEDVVPAHELSARDGRRPHGAQRRAALLHRTALEAVLRHEEDARDPGQHRDDPAEDDPRPEVPRRDPDAEGGACDRAEVRELVPAQEHPADPVHAVLVRDPRLPGAAHEGAADPSQDHGEHDHPVDGDQAEDDQRQPRQDHPDDDREPPAVGVGDDAGRHLEEEDRDLAYRPEQDELERVHARRPARGRRPRS